jgi:hypothetical protein
MKAAVAILCLAGLELSHSFTPARPSRVETSKPRLVFTPIKATPGASPPLLSSFPLYMSSADDDDDIEEDEVVEPGKMRVSEIKAELDLRGIKYADCFDKESLVARLTEARATGRANPEILEKFNKQKIEEVFSEKKLEVKDEELERIVANDGTLPGGLTPEIMTLLQSTKMQEAMKLMMTGGREELEKKLREDPELQQIVVKLNTVMGSL